MEYLFIYLLLVIGCCAIFFGTRISREVHEENLKKQFPNEQAGGITNLRDEIP